MLVTGLPSFTVRNGSITQSKVAAEAFPAKAMATVAPSIQLRLRDLGRPKRPSRARQ